MEQQQQQSPQQLNFILFLVLTFIILVGWMWLQSQLWPPQPKKKTEEQQAKKQVEKKAQPKPPEKLPWPWEDLSATAQSMKAVRLSVSGAAPLGVLETAFQWKILELPPARKKTVPPKAVAAVKTIQLGDKDYFLNAELTNHGAGVRKLTLTKFEGANWWGKPEHKPLDLIQEDPFMPSFRMYHYPDPTMEKDRFPVTTLGERIWKYEEKKSTRSKERQVIVFSTSGPPGYEYLRITKSFILEPHWYHIELKIGIDDTGKDPEIKRRPFRYQLAGAHGLPIEGGWYTYVHHNTMIGILDTGDYLHRSLQTSKQIGYYAGGDKVPQATLGNDALQYAAVGIQYFTSAIAVKHEQAEGVDWKKILAFARPTQESEEKKCIIIKIDKDSKEARLTFDKNGFGRTVRLLPRAIADLEEKEFVEKDEAVVSIYTFYENGRRTYVASRFRKGTIPKDGLDDVTVRVASEPIELKPNQSVSHQFVLYHGPLKIRQLGILSGDASVDPEQIEYYASTLQLETLADYPSASFFKTIMWTDLLIFVTNCMHWLLNGLYVVISKVNFLSFIISSEGITIIVLTVMVRGLMFPVSRRQALTSMRMQQLQPEMQKIKEKYKDDPQQLNQKIWELYRKNKVNPLGGCLPLFLQLPIFLGLYYALQESIRFRLAPFLWIDNLAAPDMLFWWSQSIPLISNPDNQAAGFFSFLYLGPYFNLLPMVAVTIMIFQQKLMMPPPTDEQQEMQQKMMKYMMVVFGIMFYKVAAGLCLYFTASSLWGMAERKLLPKKKPAGTTPAAPSTDGKAKPEKKPARPGVSRKKGKKVKEEKKPEGFFQKVQEAWKEILRQAEKK